MARKTIGDYVREIAGIYEFSPKYMRQTEVEKILKRMRRDWRKQEKKKELKVLKSLYRLTKEKA